MGFWRLVGTPKQDSFKCKSRRELVLGCGGTLVSFASLMWKCGHFALFSPVPAPESRHSGVICAACCQRVWKALMQLQRLLPPRTHPCTFMLVPGSYIPSREAAPARDGSGMSWNLTVWWKLWAEHCVGDTSPVLASSESSLCAELCRAQTFKYLLWAPALGLQGFWSQAMGADGP